MDSQPIQQQYQVAINEVNQLTELVKELAGHSDLESLEEEIIPEDYLQLLANSLYAINSLTFSYCQLKGIDFPQEFQKVKEYYTKAKNPLADGPITVVNKEAAKRVIQRHTRQQ